MMQTVTSACTSINSKRMPAIYGKLLLNNERVLDYGCGKYREHLYNYCKNLHARLYPFDPYNQPAFINHLTKTQLSERPATVGIMANVLNVIDSDDAIKEAITDALSLISCNCFLYITVYEGDKSGNGRYTSANSYQRNMKLRDYIPMLRAMGFDANIYRGMIMIRGNGKER